MTLPFIDCGDGSYVVTLDDGRTFLTRTETGRCSECQAGITIHDCAPIHLATRDAYVADRLRTAQP